MLGPGGDDTESDYLAALEDANANEWSTDRAAVNAGYTVCENLDGGAPARGSEVDLIAVQHFCTDYGADFRVLEQADVEGTFIVFKDDDFGALPADSACFPDGGYGDVNSSTQVVVRNGDSRELARTSLGEGRIGLLQGCAFNFEVPLTEGENVYILEVGDRGEISYTWEEITEDGAIELSLGDPFDF